VGESQNQPFHLSFNRFLRVAFQGSRVTSNGGLILAWELDERLGFGELIEQHLTDFPDQFPVQPWPEVVDSPYRAVLDTWTRPRFRSMGSRIRAPTAGTSSPLAFTRCCYSIEPAIVSPQSSGPVTFTAPRVGKNFCCRRSSASSGRGRKLRFAPTQHLPSQRSTRHWEERGVRYAIRIPSNDNLERDTAELIPRPVGRPSNKPLEYKRFLYQGAGWKSARRVVAKVEHHPGELHPRVGFIVTNLTLSSQPVVRFYNKRGTAEQWIKEGKQAVKMTRLSCHRFRSNEVRLWLTVIAYNLGNLWRRLVLPQIIGNWSLRASNRG
jgi:Transposase DDE domain group 1